MLCCPFQFYNDFSKNDASAPLPRSQITQSWDFNLFAQDIMVAVPPLEKADVQADVKPFSKQADVQTNRYALMFFFCFYFCTVQKQKTNCT